MSPQLPPVLWRGSGRVFGRRVALAGAIVVGVPVALALGLLLLALGVVFGIVAVVVWLVGAAAAWVWFAVQRARRIPYPFELPPPARRRPRIRSLSSLYLSLVPRTIGGVARVAGVLLSPLALLASVAGLFTVRWRARPYVAVFTLPSLLLKAVNLGRRRGLLRDGHDARTLLYDDYLASAFPLLADFGQWWRDPHGPHDYTPSPGLPDVPAGLTGLHLGPYPDPLGYPGLAVSAMRRRSIRSLRDVFLSQREIDDLCDPDLDDRAEIGVIRVCRRRDERGVRHWIVQFASTKSWDPRRRDRAQRSDGGPGHRHRPRSDGHARRARHDARCRDRAGRARAARRVQPRRDGRGSDRARVRRPRGSRSRTSWWAAPRSAGRRCRKVCACSPWSTCSTPFPASTAGRTRHLRES